MSDELHELRKGGYRPLVVGPTPFLLEDILQNIDPAPDEETERFVEAIYRDRREAAADSTPE